MKLVIIGTGYVGLVSGLCFAEFGFQTVCVDKDTDKIDSLNKGKCPFYEPGLENLLSKHLNKTKLFSLNSSAIFFVLLSVDELISCRTIVDSVRAFDLKISPTVPKPKFVLPAPIKTILLILIILIKWQYLYIIFISLNKN